MPQRNLTENVLYLGSSFGSGFVLEMADETMTDNTVLATGLGVGALGIAGSMFVRGPLVENALDGLAAGSFSFVGSKMRETGTLSGIIGGGQGGQTAAGGSPRVVRVNNPSGSGGSKRSGNQSSSASGNVVEM